ncbi:hypothetical protein CPB86DRAFT_779023 [Serendipita vermifera]|nr:hypothetical protein CPB86DRAFT_779023 [Serendipita vermifera]
MGWNELPVELMEVILSQIDQLDLSSLRFISRATNHVLCPLIWKRKILCVQWRDLPYLEEIMDSNSLSYPLSQLVTGLKVRMVPSRIPAVTQTPSISFFGAKVEATRQYKTLSALIGKSSDRKKTRPLEEQTEWSITDAGLDVFYRVVRKFVNLRILGGPSLDALLPSSPSPLEPSIITRSDLYPFRNIEELRLNGVWLNRREGKVTPGDLIRCLLDFPHLKTLVAHIKTDEIVHPLMYPPTEINCALRRLELTVARTRGQLMDSLVQFLRFTKNLHTFTLDDRTTRKTMGGFTNSFVFEQGGLAPELDILRIVKALSGSHKSLVRLNLTQYDPFSSEARPPVPISFRQFTTLQTLVIPFAPVLPTDLQDIKPHTRCFPDSLTALTILRGTKLSLNELTSILHLLRGSLSELGAYVMGNYGTQGTVVHRRGKLMVTVGDRFQRAQWIHVQIKRSRTSKAKGQCTMIDELKAMGHV